MGRLNTMARCAAAKDTAAWSSTASATAVSRMAKEAADAGKSAEMAKMMDARGASAAREVAELADEGDEGARRVYSEVGRVLGISLAYLVNTLNLAAVCDWRRGGEFVAFVCADDV